ncbi:MAG TPA: 1,3-beta-glucanase, partial [Pilimelia sp.]|nr:1,3-beta-glucanase [Pilimelia sp.]
MRASTHPQSAGPSPAIPRRAVRALTAAGSAAVLGAAALLTAFDATAAVPPTPTGWTRVFADDFTGASGTLP